MKTKLLLLCVAAMSFAPCFPQGTVKWEEMARNDRQVVEIDFSSIKRTDDGFFVWMRSTYLDTDYYITDMVNDLKSTGKLSTFTERETWQNWTHSVSYCDFHDETMTPLGVTHYNDDGTVIVKIDFPVDKRTTTLIPPDSLLAQTYLLLNSTFVYDVNNKKYTMRIEDIDMFTELNPTAEYVGFY